MHDHRGIVYRSKETKDELQDVVRSWDPMTAPTGLNCHADRNWSGQLTMPGPGEQQTATQRWFLEPGFDVRERDVLSIVSGPRSPVNLRVQSVTPCTMPVTLHHYEIVGDVSDVDLTEEPEES